MSKRKIIAKRVALGATAGAVVGVLMGLSYGLSRIATWDDVKRSMPQAVVVGIGMGGVAALLGAPPLAAGLAVGTGLYLRNVVRALASPSSSEAA